MKDNYMKQIHILFIINFVMITIASIVSVSAAILFDANDVSFNNASSGLASSDVQSAIDELYSESNDYSSLRAKIYPVGSIYMSYTDDTVAKVQARFGGTWEKFAAGKMIIGVDSNDTDFNAPLKTGGSESHYHAASDLRAKIGAFNSNQSAIGYVATSAWDPATGAGAANTTYGISYGSAYTKNVFNHFTVVYGITNTKPNVMQYRAIYMYRRTA